MYSCNCLGISYLWHDLLGQATGQQGQQRQQQQRQQRLLNKLNRQDKIPKPQLERKEIEDNSNELSWEITEQAFN